MSAALDVRLVDYHRSDDANALVAMLDAYARDPMGGGEPLSAHARANVVGSLASMPHAFSVLAFDGGAAVGFANCFEGFSTFACRPLVNIHDFAVLASSRGRGVGQALMACIEEEARRRGACKLTLEVLQGNRAAYQLYQRLGFANYQLDPAMGHAEFLQKYL
ncbi:GNAT family N-acetyltransferase [Curvibacter sp. APW13]|uniref:GNAT family N-acetyltransferase n=1 Tax=Curvibacter sp. APW13 TaxID=3077236 RepID=UPI0028DE0F10|nr:GNAT family N-acetyltransferase [Curvibacter sp. APW13]MDT8992181.1 GNAT family N-acetyltransferase [Curvibacter sp. APW13]